MTKQELAKAIMWMMDKGYTTGHGDTVVDLLQELEWQVAEREREACAKVCEELVLAYAGNASATANQCADAIRARGDEERFSKDWQETVARAEAKLKEKNT